MAGLRIEKVKVKCGSVGFYNDGKYRKKEESLKPVGVLGFFLELLARFELATS